MRYQTHLLTSFTGAVALSHVVDLPVGLAFTGGILLGCLLPDIDEPNSFIGRRTSVSYAKGRDGQSKRIGLSSLINRVFGHRGFTHSVIATALLALLLLVWQHAFVYGLVLGYALHIAGDMFSKTGVPLFHPLFKTRFKIHLYTTGKFSEKIIFGVTVLALALLVDKNIIEWVKWT